MKAYLPALTDSDLVVDRIHRLPKPSHLPDNIPRDVLMRVHFFQTKEQFMIAFRKNQQPPEQYFSIQLSQIFCNSPCRSANPLYPSQKALRNHDCNLWYPSELTITYDGNTSVINNLDDGLKLLCAWDILPAQTSERSAFCLKDGHSRKINKKTPDHLGYLLNYKLLDSYSTVECTVHKLPLFSNE